jgi:hypothetical protein
MGIGWTHLLKQQSSITVYVRQVRHSTSFSVSISSKQTVLCHFRFLLVAINGRCRFRFPIAVGGHGDIKILGKFYLLRKKIKPKKEAQAIFLDP